jgi:hypothetical protein
MEDYGVKYSVGGKSVIGNTNARELGYSTQYNTLKTFKQDTISYAVANGITTKTIHHGLDYRPAFNVYYRDTLTGEVYQSSTFHQDGAAREDAEISVEAKSDNYNLTLRINNSNASSRNVDIFYEIFYEDVVQEPQFFIG